MKKFLLLAAACALFGCADVIEPGPSSADLVRVNAEPIGCQFLYKLETEVSIYDTRDAEQYLRNRIADQVRGGNTYWIVSERTRPNKWVVFGPERAFVYTANVYRCPDIRNVVTRSDSMVDTGFYQTGNNNTAGQYTVYSGANPSPVVNFDQPGTTYVARPSTVQPAPTVRVVPAAAPVYAPDTGTYTLDEMFEMMFGPDAVTAAAPAQQPASTCCAVPVPVAPDILSDSDLK
ncbi:MAG: hypothetical protein FWC51_00120 [Proteobacteria bacterium]|nr:hypothetical protein [Pseudomonadota bacterium]